MSSATCGNDFAMNPEAQRIAIAEACGYRNILKGGMVYLPDEVANCKLGNSKSVPDYLNDLNAMHEAEEVFGEFGSEIWAKYQRNLRGGDIAALSGELCHATAAQRAEAFLRTLGLWELPPAGCATELSHLRE
jgi:hypothetical protein